MKRHLFPISVALMMSLFTFTSCVDNKESESVTNIRDAKAEQLKSLAGMYKAQGEAELIRANFEKAYKDALTAMQLLKNEEKSLENDVLKAAQLTKIEAAIAQAKADLATALADQARNEASLKTEKDKVFTQALTEYDNAFKRLYNDPSGYVIKLNQAQSDLITLKSDLVKIERWVESELLNLNIQLAGDKEALKIYTASGNKTYEQRKADFDAATILQEELSLKKDQIKELEEKQKSVYSEKKDYINVTIKHEQLQYYVSVFMDNDGYIIDEQIYDGMNSYVKQTKVSHNPSYSVSVSYPQGGNKYAYDQKYNKLISEGIRVSSPFATAALANTEYFKPTGVTFPDKTYTLDAANSLEKTISGYIGIKYELIDAAGYKASIDLSKKNLDGAIVAKTAAITAYNAAVAASAAAKTAWESAPDASKAVKKAEYEAAKQQSNISRLEMDYAVSSVDGGKVVRMDKILVSSNPIQPTDKSSKTSTDITHETVEGVYDATVEVTVTDVNATTNTTDVYSYVYYTNLYASAGMQKEYEKAKADYDWITNTANVSAYDKAFTDFGTALVAYQDSQSNTALANYNYDMASSKHDVLYDLLDNTTDVSELIKETNIEIEDTEAKIANVKNLDSNSGSSANKKEQAIAYKNAEIAKLQTDVSLGEVILKNCKAAIDALMK